jgi:hypothetical protein
MSISHEKELAVTREKLRLLEDRVAVLRRQVDGDPTVRELTLRSLMSMVNQLREEIARFKAGARATG